MPSPEDLEQFRPLAAQLGTQMRSPETVKAETDAEIIAVKQLRVGLDAQLQALKKLWRSDERVLCRTKITEAVMWLGMDLKRLNDTRPYPSSYDPSNAKVEPTADGLKL